MPNWFEGVLKLRGPFNRIVDFIKNGLYLERDTRQSYIEDVKAGLQSFDIENDCPEALIYDCIQNTDGHWVAIKNTDRAFVIMEQTHHLYLSTVYNTNGYTHEYHDILMSKFGIPTPIPVSIVDKIDSNGIIQKQLARKLDTRDDIFVKFKIAVAWLPTDTEFVAIAKRFGLDIRIEGIEPGHAFSYVVEVDRFGNYYINESINLLDPDNLWVNPYPIVADAW